MLEGKKKLNGDYNFWKGFILSITFFTITPIVIASTIFSLFYIKKDGLLKTDKVKVNPKTFNSGVSIYASLPSRLPELGSTVDGVDARSKVLKKYLRYYHSPLENYAEKLVEEADKNGLDYHLLTAIAQQESNLCKLIPPGSHNCWGWGIHSKGSLSFSSYDKAIETVSKGIKTDYVDEGFKSIEDIMSKYTPMSNGSWAFGVSKFMFDIENI
jgi:hypothetical protein